MEKSNELSEDLRRRIVDLQKLERSLGAVYKQLQIPRSSVQTNVCKYKLFRCVTTLSRSGRRPKLSPSDERKLVRMCRNHRDSSLP
uniref:Sleeping Beauty transposase HTH domain-containing protein n=1 Tax=Amphilophus citrinellus TaxID=61819 RepID=A0A3Q0R2E4_AMPCI